MRKNQKSITILDVAEAAGVSVSTVSRVLNDKDDVAYDTYQRVQSVIEELGYSSSLAARSMRSRRTNVIGLIIPDVDDPFSIQVIKGVYRAIIEMDYDLLIYTSGSIRYEMIASKEQQYITLLNSSLTDGAIIVAPTSTEHKSAAPVVAVDPNIHEPAGPAVISTNLRGAEKATNHLLQLGHRRIGYIGGRTDLVSGVHRRMGYEKALVDFGIEPDPTLMTSGNFTARVAVECANYLLDLDTPPTAIFASNDRSAFGVMQVANERGIRIPEELSLVGYDNIPEAEFCNLTTVDQFIDKMSYLGTKLLIDLIQEKPIDSLLVEIESKIIIRGTTAPV